jgi:tetratricopeptide (TPR) repeat protein
LFTSRNRDLQRLGKLLEIPPMTPEEGVSLLLHGYDDHDIQHHAIASKIVARLGGLALAIDQAAAYIKHMEMPLDQLGNFLTTFEAQARQTKKILDYTPKNFWEYGKIHGEREQNSAISAFTTWEMSFQQLGPDDDIAHFLTLSAFFDPARIDESLFRYHWEAGASPPEWMRVFNPIDEESDEEDGEVQQRQRWSSEQFWELIAKYHNLSLLQSISRGNHGGANFSLHPLIRDWLQLRQEPKGRRTYTTESIQVVLSSIKRCNDCPSMAKQNATLLAHMDACMLNDARFSKSTLSHGITSCDEAEWFASFYEDQGRYSVSEKIRRLTVETQKDTHGKEHPSTLTSMNNLARVLSHQGKYEEAEEMHRQALRLKETVLGKEHPSTLTSMNNLADVLSHRGKYKEAEEMHRQELELCRMVLGKEHPSTLTSMNNLASIYWNQGRWDEAEKLEIQVMEGRLRVLGQEHPLTLISMANLAYTWKSQGRDGEAITLMKQAESRRIKVLGIDHPNTRASSKALEQWRSSTPNKA